MEKITIKLTTLLILCLAIGCKDNLQSDSNKEISLEDNQKEVLLIGTFHFNNPGADVVKTKSFDILKDESQKELELIASKIKEFNPTKIFVEWSYEEQSELDSLYYLYQKDQYFSLEGLNNFYKKNEIFQLAFRAAKLNNLETVYGIDYEGTQFPFDSVMSVIAEEKQLMLQSEIEKTIKKVTSDFDNKIAAGTSLIDLMYDVNSNEEREMSNKFHNQVPLIAGGKNNLIGPFLTSEWHKRNLYMWSLIQKRVNDNDQRIMILLGASHVAMIKNFIDQNQKWKAIELKSIM